MLRHFIIKELISPEIWVMDGEQSISHMDKELLISIDQIRDFFNRPVIVNNWHNGGKFKYRGFRPKDCKIGAKNSMHKLGQAIDFDVVGLTAEEVRGEIIKHRELFPYVTRIEAGVNWIHIDNKKTFKNEIILFNP